MEMLSTIADPPTARAGHDRRRLRFAVAVLVLQALAGAFFVADSISDWQTGSGGESLEIDLFEIGIALALLGGIALGAWLVRRLFLEARERERVIAVAKGALAEVIGQRFGEWGLSAAEREVALFALKGCSITEIARLRKAQAGTVRSQLSQVYAKAGVSSQPMFVSLFIEELLGS